MSTLQDRIKSYEQSESEKFAAEKAAENEALNKRIDALRPMFETLKEALEFEGLNVKLHTDIRHFPCPAIHVKGQFYEQFGEIFLSVGDDVKWRSGGCNSHNNSFASDDELIDFIAKTIGQHKATVNAA